MQDQLNLPMSMREQPLCNNMKLTFTTKEIHLALARVAHLLVTLPILERTQIPSGPILSARRGNIGYPPCPTVSCILTYSLSI